MGLYTIKSGILCGKNKPSLDAKFRENILSRYDKLLCRLLIYGANYAVVPNFYHGKHVLALFAKMKFSRKFQNLQYLSKS